MTAAKEPSQRPFSGCVDKVNEAYHFLLLMRVAELPEEAETVPGRLQGEDAFRFAFSAFLSAARTVLYLLQEDGVSIPGFTRWYVTARERWLRDDISTFFGERRHFRITFPSGEASVALAPNTLEHPRVDPLGAAELPDIQTSGHDGAAAFRERPAESATELCAQYLERLSALVSQAQHLAA